MEPRNDRKRAIKYFALLLCLILAALIKGLVCPDALAYSQLPKISFRDTCLQAEVPEPVDFFREGDLLSLVQFFESSSVSLGRKPASWKHSMMTGTRSHI